MYASIYLPEVGIGKGFLAVFAAAKLPSEKSPFLSLRLVLPPQPAGNKNQTLKLNRLFLQKLFIDEVAGL